MESHIQDLLNRTGLWDEYGEFGWGPGNSVSATIPVCLAADYAYSLLSA